MTAFSIIEFFQLAVASRVIDFAGCERIPLLKALLVRVRRDEIQLSHCGTIRYDSTRLTRFLNVLSGKRELKVLARKRIACLNQKQ